MTQDQTLAGFTVTNHLGDPHVQVAVLLAVGRLGYVAPSDEWTDGDEPLPDHLQDAANSLFAAGLLPEFEEDHRA